MASVSVMMKANSHQAYSTSMYLIAMVYLIGLFWIIFDILQFLLYFVNKPIFSGQKKRPKKLFFGTRKKGLLIKAWNVGLETATKN